MLAERKRFQIGLVLTVLSGAAALSHQLLWTHRMTDLLGSSAQSTTRVFSCFFLGLACGAGVMGWKVPRMTRPWRWLALAECGIAVLCLPALWLADWTDWIWPWLGPDGLLGWQGALVKWILSMGVVFIPAFAMGTTLPLLIRGVGSNSKGRETASVWLYAFNTMGGLLGLGCTAFFALYVLGVSGSMGMAISLNVLIAAAALWTDFRVQATHVGKDGNEKQTRWLVGFRSLGWPLTLTAFASGFLILALEILAMDLVMLVAPLSFHAPLAVLGSFIFALALGAAVVPLLGMRWATDGSFLRRVLVSTALLTALGPLFFVRMAMAGTGVQTAESLMGFTSSLVVLVLATFGPGLLLGGLLFPSLLRMIPRECDQGAAVGYLLAVNGLGGLLGAECAYAWIMPLVGVYQGIGIVAFIYALMACCWIRWNQQPWFQLGRVGVPAALVMVAVSFPYLRQLPVVNPNMGLKVLDLRFGREGNLAVVEHDQFGRGLLFSNQYLLGSTNVRYDQERQAHIPLLLHPNPQKICCIGLATGITPSAALQHSTVQKVDVVELASMVVDAAGEYFSEYNSHILDQSSVQVAVEDGRTFIAAHQEAYDVIVSDLFLPWRPGVGRLYSSEHFEATRDALRPGGLYCHWLPLYQFTESQLDLVLSTFMKVYPKAYLFEGKFQLDAPVLGLVGFKDGDLDWDGIRSNCDRERLAQGIKDPTMRHAQGLAMLFRGTMQHDRDADDVNTLNNMKLELDAGVYRMMHAENGTYLMGKTWFALVQKYIQSNAFESSTISSRSMASRGVQLSLLGHRIQLDAKSRPALLKQTFALIPDALKRDREADWKRWGGTEINVRWKTKDKDG